MSDKSSSTTASEGAVDARIRVAEVLAFVAVVAALVGALGPAEHVSTTYSWPPPTLSDDSPTRFWYTPLLLQERRPESIAANLSCAPGRPLAGAERPVTVLATARSPERAGGLSVREDGDRLAIAIGDVLLRHVPLSRGLTAPGDCAYRLVVDDRRWSVVGGPTGAEHAGTLAHMPVVNGLFSALDLSEGQPPSIEVTTEVHRADPIARQTVAWVVAAVCAAVALLLVAVGRRPRRSLAVRPHLRRALAQAHPVDGVIAVLLAGWWVLSPAFWDDGWALARQEAFLTTGSFSNYYDSLGAALPLGFWLDWVQHLLTQHTAAGLLLRLPALACIAAAWVLCRCVLSRGLQSSGAPSAVALWALTSSFAVGAMAWGMTLRPEPVVALLVTAVMACSVRFAQRRSPAPLAAAAVLVSLAVTAHPAGLVSVAPLIVIVPSLVRWARSQPAHAATLLVSSFALVLTLTFVGSDVEQRSTDAQIVRDVSVTVTSWRDELNRYQRFAPNRTAEYEPYGTPLRRASVALIGIALLAFAVRRRVRGPADFAPAPSAVLAVSLLLLVATPSKWPWHFGVLAGLTALAIAAETEYLRTELRRRASVWLAVAAIALSTVAVAWSWAPQRAWNPLDLRTLEWTAPFEAFPALAAFIGLPLLALLGFSWVRARRSRDDRGRFVSRSAPWTTPVLLVPMVAFTVAFLAADAARTSSWTFTRQNLGGVSGNVGCGLADDLLIPRLDSVRPVRVAIPGENAPVPDWVPPAPVPGVQRFALGPTDRGTASSPWHTLPRGRRVGLFVAGIPGQLDRLTLDFGRRSTRGIEPLGGSPFAVDVTSQGSSSLVWRFIPAGELPSLPEAADVIRVTLRSDARPGAAIAVTGPVVYDLYPLTRTLDGSASLVAPNVRLYFPCIRLPTLSNGVAEAPETTVTTINDPAPVTFAETSPFGGVLELYELRRIPLADAEIPPGGMSAFELIREIPGGRVAAPIATNRSS